MPWCRVTVTYAGTGYFQHYKRMLAIPSQPLIEQFNLEALLRSLDLINANLPPGHGVVAHSQLGLRNQADLLESDPGGDHTEI